MRLINVGIAIKVLLVLWVVVPFRFWWIDVNGYFMKRFWIPLSCCWITPTVLLIKFALKGYLLKKKRAQGVLLLQRLRRYCAYVQDKEIAEKKRRNYLMAAHMQEEFGIRTNLL